jgi:hypothetical protein
MQGLGTGKTRPGPGWCLPTLRQKLRCRTQRVPPRLQWGRVTRFVRRKQQLFFRIPLSLLCLPVGRGRRMLRQNGFQLPRRYTPRRYHRLALPNYLAGFFGSRRQAPPSIDHP